MPWLKAGDNAATHPVVMRPIAWFVGCIDQVFEGDVIVNELFGFMTRCALQSAGHTTDYMLEYGTMLMLGGTRTDVLIKHALRAGYITKTKSRLVTYKLIDDPEFLHIRLRAEIDWEKQQAADSSNPALTAPVRFRDGDACRYCRKIVWFKSRKGGRAGTYRRVDGGQMDHRTPGAAAQSPDDLVVACGSCNPGRKDGGEAAEPRYPLQPPPLNPFYGPETAAFLANHGYIVTATEDLEPGTWLPGTTPSDPATSGTTPPPPTKRAPVNPRSADSADHLPKTSGSTGSGRDGTGSTAVPTANVTKRKRARRGSRGRPRTSGAT